MKFPANSLIILLFPFLFFSCKQLDLGIAKISGKQLNINDSIRGDDSIKAFIAPYKEHISKEMDSVLAYAPNSLVKTQGELNSAIGNMMADAVMTLGNPIFKNRTGHLIDVVLLNYGGIRSGVQKGNITTRTAYELMPFENEVVVASLSGRSMKNMVAYLVKAQVAHPISGMQLILNKDNSVKEILIQGEPLADNKIYYVATNDYLYSGGDEMYFFSEAEEKTDLDYKIRNILIDYFKKNDTISPEIDNRFIRK